MQLDLDPERHRRIARLSKIGIGLGLFCWCFGMFATGVNVECGKLELPAKNRLKYCKIAERFAHPILTEHQLAASLLNHAIALAEIGRDQDAGERFKKSWHLQNPYRSEINRARSETIRRMNAPEIPSSALHVWRAAIAENQFSK